MSDDDIPTPSAFEQATMSQASGTLRLILGAAGGWLVNRGYSDQGSMNEIVSGLATLLVAFAWVLWSRRKTGILKSASRAIGSDGVIIVSDQATADKLPSNVVGPRDDTKK
jgi:uncharacterized membrane protein